MGGGGCVGVSRIPPQSTVDSTNVGCGCGDWMFYDEYCEEGDRLIKYRLKGGGGLEYLIGKRWVRGGFLRSFLKNMFQHLVQCTHFAIIFTRLSTIYF